jgi:prolyl oligopeptidase
VYRLVSKDGAVTTVDLPQNVSVGDVASDPLSTSIFLEVEGWTTSAHWLSTNGAGAARDAFPDQPKEDWGDVLVENVQATSRDGTRVPLTILSRRDTPRDGSAPTILSGYGAYEVSTTPRFRAERNAWLRRGGVLAYAHPRGGGELGREWHLAGMREKKQNSIDDFIACAEELVRTHRARPEHLGASGNSAGGLLVAVAMTQRPDLFRAVYSTSGMVNLLRQLKVGIGPANVEEFGAPDSLEHLHAILKMDAYQQVRNGVQYPAFLATTGMNDARVPYWQSAKLVAALQAEGTGDRPALLWIDPELGHKGGTPRQYANLLAYQYAFFAWQLGGALDSVSSAAPR